MEPHPLFYEVASQIADGETIDWDRLEGLLAADGSGRSLLEQLKELAGLRTPPASAPTTPLTTFGKGDRIADRFVVERFLDRGGMGEVYLVRDVLLAAPLALKIIRPEIALDPVALRRFKREVLLARSITHPNVCRIYEFGVHDDGRRPVWFLTMEFLEGETLLEYLQREGRLEAEEIREIARQSAEALDAAHRAGIVHRDFKTSNIMILPGHPQPRVVVMDFGLAQLVGRDIATPAMDRHPEGIDTDSTEVTTTVLEAAGPDGVGLGTSPGRIAGTPAYMAPEQVMGEAVGPAADLYAFGVVLFEIATGQLPFCGSDGLQVARARLIHPPRRPSDCAPVDPNLESIIVRLLERDPGKRFTWASEAISAWAEPKAAPARPYRLPAEVDPFVGRPREIAELSEAMEMESTRLLTLTGMGGTGKTRLAVHYGWSSLDRWSGGIWFCDLSEARDTDGVVHAVATALGHRLGSADSVASIGSVIADLGRCLILLDNVEQVAGPVASILDTWMGCADEVRFLVTSRERLRLPREVVYDVVPLELESEAIELFEARGRTHHPGFAVDEANWPVVSDIVRMVDGLPLAIELAAARLGVLGLNQLHERLEDRLRLLGGGPRGRHQTLQATLDWSWNLLEPWEQSAAIQLSVFQAGCTLEAAEVVVELPIQWNAPPVLDILQSLVDKSWLRVRASEQEPRFEMFATVQQYLWVRGRLAEKPADSMERLAVARHFGYFLQFAETWSERLRGADASVAQDVLRRENENFLVVFRRTPPLLAGLADRFLMAARLGGFWEREGTWPTALRILCDLLDDSGAPETPATVRAAVCMAAGGIARLGADYDLSERLSGQGLSLARSCGANSTEVSCLNNLAATAMERGEMNDARLRWEEALAACREEKATRTVAVITLNLGAIAIRQGDFEEGRRRTERSLEVFTELGDARARAGCLSHLAAIAGETGDCRRSRELAEQAVAIYRAERDWRGLTDALSNLASSCRDLGDYDRAHEHLREALEIEREQRDTRGTAQALYGLGLNELFRSDPDAAFPLLQEALGLWRSIGQGASVVEALEALAWVHSARAECTLASRLLGAAESMRERMGVPVSPFDERWVEGVRERCRSALGEERELRERRHGRELTLDELILEP